MKKTSLNVWNKTAILFSVSSFIIQLIPNIDENLKKILLIASPILLIMVYLSLYFKAIDRIENEINELEKRLGLDEKVLNSLVDNKLIENIKEILKNQKKNE